MADDATYFYIALSSVHPGRDQDYVDWYFDKHLPDMTAVPGVEGGQFYRAVGQNNRWGYCGFFQVSVPNIDVVTVAGARAQSGEMRMTDASDPAQTLMIDAVMQTKGGTIPSADAGDRCLLGFNGDVSAADLKAWGNVDGVVKVHAMSLADTFAVWKAPWRTLVMCDVRSGQAVKARAALAAASGHWRDTRNYVGAFEHLTGPA